MVNKVKITGIIFVIAGSIPYLITLCGSISAFTVPNFLMTNEAIIGEGVLIVIGGLILFIARLLPRHD